MCNINWTCDSKCQKNNMLFLFRVHVIEIIIFWYNQIPFHCSSTRGSQSVCYMNTGSNLPCKTLLTTDSHCKLALLPCVSYNSAFIANFTIVTQKNCIESCVQKVIRHSCFWGLFSRIWLFFLKSVTYLCIIVCTQ